MELILVILAKVSNMSRPIKYTVYDLQMTGNIIKDINMKK